MKVSYVLNDETTFENVVEALDAGGMGFLALVDDQGVLQGIITDGDIRRALLKKDFTVTKIMNRNPEFMDYQSSKREIVSRLRTLHRRHMPLVDRNGVFKSVYDLDQFEFASRPNKVVIMAGGLGTRLGDLTKEIPKPMLTVGNKPMLLHLIELFADQGFRDFIFCVNYKKEIIQEYFGTGEGYGVKINYIEEQKRMGTAGALSLIEETIESPFIVINADVLAYLDFAKLVRLHVDTESVATMCVRQQAYQVQFGVVNSDEEGIITSIDEKPMHRFNINAGVYVLDPSVLKRVPEDVFFDMPTLFDNLIDDGLLTKMHQIDDYWVDIGRKEDLFAVDRALSLKE